MKYSIAAAIIAYAAAASAAPANFGMNDINESIAKAQSDVNRAVELAVCNQPGVQYSIWVKGSPENAVKAQDWDPASLDNKGQPNFAGRRQAIGTGDMSFSGFADGHQGMIYNHGPMDTGHVAIKHEAYIYAYMDGDYTFTMTGTDDATYVYAGKDCEGSATKNSAGMALFGSQTLGGADSTKAIQGVKKGYYIPFEVRWANVMRGPYNLALTITGPDGTVLLNKEGSKHVLSNSCKRPGHIVWKASGLV